MQRIRRRRMAPLSINISNNLCDTVPTPTSPNHGDTIPALIDHYANNEYGVVEDLTAEELATEISGV